MFAPLPTRRRSVNATLLSVAAHAVAAGLVVLSLRMHPVQVFSLPGTDLHTPGLTASVTFDQAPGGGWTNPEPRSSGVMGKTRCSAHTGNKYLIFELPFRLGRLGSL